MISAGVEEEGGRRVARARGQRTGTGGISWRSSQDAEVREVLKVADLNQAEGLLKHCLEAFGGGLTVETAVDVLV